jgi:hypothetical protein
MLGNLLNEIDPNYQIPVRPLPRQKEDGPDVDVDAKFNSSINGFGRTVESLYFVDQDDNHTRDFFLSLDQAKDVLQEHFNIENGKAYVISYLTNYGWKSRTSFEKTANTNLSHHTYDGEAELSLYGGLRLSDDDIHVYGIVVKEVRN